VFGIFRYGLAFCVAISHLWAGMIPGPAAYAVWGFYCLSGYLMTLILNEKYGFSRRGLINFAANRVLRIYPAYYVVCAAMFLIFWLIPDTAAGFLPNLRMPQTAQGWCYSLLLMSTPDGDELLHGSMALRVELWFYVAIALGLGRGRRIAWAWFLASLGYTVWLLALRTPFPERYIFIPACSLAFSAGCLLYHLRTRLPVIKTKWATLAAASLWWLHVWLSLNLPGGPWVVGLYSSLLCSAFAVLTLMRLDPRQQPNWMVRLDRLAGNLSYPIYLCHWSMGILVTWFFPARTRTDVFVFLVGFPLLNLVSLTIYHFVERPLQSWKLPSLVRPGQGPVGLSSAIARAGRIRQAGAAPGPHSVASPKAGSSPNGRSPLLQAEV
jgi:peptidoglycan/LPS O-acetylase OafA/YrhL